MKSKADIIKELEEFQQLLYSWEREYRPQTRSAINKKIRLNAKHPWINICS